MGVFEKDFVMRQIRLLAQAIAQIVSKARSEGAYATGLEEVRKTAGDALGMDYGMLSRMDPASVALLAREGEVLRTLAWIAAQEGDLHGAAGDSAEARRLRGRAVALYGECALRFPEEAHACREAACALLTLTDLQVPVDEFRHWFGASETST